ncbi:hypothetical protein WJX72_010917 [[Myrmecia] bisecta]|uniref:Uncharacterized protein n=1 Tax=[Myrmecia] bisecta TaxID=41462 RepID=A0AAW1PNL4_9CHLO
MLVLTSKPALIALLLGGMLAHGIWITTWAYLEIRGRVQTHTFLDTQLTYLVIVVIQSFTLGQLGPPQVDKPNFLTQLGQPNWQVVLFALSSGACIALGDLLMQTAGAQLGVAVGPAIIFAVGIAGGVVLSFFLDKGLNTASLLFTGGGCALAAVVFGALAHIAANKHVPVFDISRDGSRSYRHARFMGGQGVGFGIAYVLYAAPLVSTILGIVLFGEFRDSSRKAQGFLAAQVVLYAAAIGFLIAAANTRK